MKDDTAMEDHRQLVDYGLNHQVAKAQVRIISFLFLNHF